MRKTNILISGLVAIATVGLVGCDVKKTQEGSVTAPKVEVTKTQEGNITVPKYDVTTPDVKVGTKKEELTVPKITTQKETLTVPTIQIQTADEKKAAQGKN